MQNGKIIRIAFLSFLVAVTSLGNGTTANAAPDFAHMNKKVTYCISCHHESGAGFNGAVPIPRLAGQTPEYLDAQIKAFAEHTRDNPNSKNFMWNAVHGMTAEEKAAVIKYFSDMKDTPPSGGAPSVDAKHLALGKEIFEHGVGNNVAACNMCHGEKGEGNGAIPSIAGQRYDYFLQAFHDWRHGFRKNADPMPGYAKVMANDKNEANDQIEALAQYLSTLKNNPNSKNSGSNKSDAEKEDRDSDDADAR